MHLTPEERRQKEGWIQTTLCLLRTHERCLAEGIEKVERYRQAIANNQPIELPGGYVFMPTQRDLSNAIKSIARLDQTVTHQRARIRDVQHELGLKPDGGDLE